MLLGSAFSQRLEPVSIMGDTVLCGPLLHAGSYCIGYLAIQVCTVVHHVNHLLIDVLRQVFIHLLAIEYFLAKVLCGSFTWNLYVEGLLLECLTDYLKS